MPRLWASRSSRNSSDPEALCQSRVAGVAQPASSTVLRLESLFPAALLPFCAGVPAIGVGHPASCAIAGSATVALLPSGRRPVGEASFAIWLPSELPTVGVGHPASCAIVETVAPRFCPSQELPNFAIWSRFVCTFSLALGVGHPASAAICPNGFPVSQGLASFTPRTESCAVHVGHPLNAAAPGNRSIPCPGPPFGPSCEHGVGHPVQSLAYVRRTDARSANIKRPCGVALAFQVSLYKVEPSEAVRTRHLFAKDCDRAALADKVEEEGP